MTPRLCVYRVDCKAQLDFVRVNFFSGSRCEFFEILHVSKELIIVRVIFRLLHAWDLCSVTYTVCRIQNKRFSNARVEMASQNLANAPDQKRSLEEWSYIVKRCRFGNALVRVSLMGTIDTMSQGTGSSFVKAKRSGTKQTASRLCTACLRVQDCLIAEVLLLEQITCCQWSKIMNATACFALFPVSGLPISHPQLFSIKIHKQHCCVKRENLSVTLRTKMESFPSSDIACPCSCFTTLCGNLLHLSSRGPDCAVLRPTWSETRLSPQWQGVAENILTCKTGSNQVLGNKLVTNIRIYNCIFIEYY